MTSQFPDKILTATDPVSELEGRLTLHREVDDGVSAINVALFNPTDHPVVLKVNTELSAFLLVAATDDRGRQLSTPSRKFATDEQQGFQTVALQPGNQQSWRTALADWIPADRVPEEGLSGRLVVNVALVLTTDHGDQQPMLTLYDTDVRFTRRAIVRTE